MLVIQDVDQAHVFLQVQAEWLEHQVTGIHQVGRYVAQRIDHEIHVHFLRPVGQHVVRRVEIHRRDHGDQILHFLRMQRGVAQRERPALADAQQVDRFQAGTFAQVVHCAIDETVDVVVQHEEAIGAIRIAPVQDVDVFTTGQQSLDQRAVRLQVDHVRAVDQCIGDQQRYARGGCMFANEPIQHDLAVTPHFFLAGGAVMYVLHFRQGLQASGQLLLQGDGFLRQHLRGNIQRPVHLRAPFLPLFCFGASGVLAAA